MPIFDVDPKSYWLYTNDPYDNQKRKEAFETYGFEKGLAYSRESRDVGSRSEPPRLSRPCTGYSASCGTTEVPEKI